MIHSLLTAGAAHNLLISNHVWLLTPIADNNLVSTQRCADHSPDSSLTGFAGDVLVPARWDKARDMRQAAGKAPWVISVSNA